MSTTALTSSTFAQAIADHAIVIVDFWAGWCAPCRAFAPRFEAASETHRDIFFGKIDTEAEPALAEAFSVRSIPTLIVFRDQIIVFAEPGALSAPALDDVLSQARALDMEQVRRELSEQAGLAS